MKGAGVKILRIGLSNVFLSNFITGTHDTIIIYTHIYIYTLAYAMGVCRRFQKGEIEREN